MKRAIKNCLWFLFFSYSSQGFAQALPVEKGVSQKLAAYRKANISDVHYQLYFSIPINKQDPIDAHETILFYLKQNIVPLQIDFEESSDHLLKIAVNGKDIPTEFLDEHIIIPPGYLKQGANEIRVAFTAGDLSLNRNNDYLYSLLVPDRARTLFPCFDQPDIKARFHLQLSVPEEWKVLSNAPIENISDSADRKNYRFKVSDVFSTYLFSFVAGKFDVAKKEMANRLMHFYYRENDTSKIRLSLDTVFAMHDKAIGFLENYTGIKFPFQKMDFAAIPDFQYGGMEHVGAIDYRASSLFLDSGATEDRRNARSNLIAHETSHMWFGDLVTMQWFNDVWMKEVFANFMADKITRDSDESYELKFLLDHFPSAYAVDRTQGANAIRQNLSNLNEAGSLYGAIIYDKAPVMMRQLERLMGADAFREGLREYLRTFSYANAGWPELISILDERTPKDLQTWNKVWVKTAGRPVIDYKLKRKGEKIQKLILTQKGERNRNYVLPQLFKLALVYSDHIEELNVDMNRKNVALTDAKGKKMPLYILFNSSGDGYGLFPVDKNMMNYIEQCSNPVMRASAYINLYENMLEGKSVKPAEFMSMYLSLMPKEKEELNLTLMASQLLDVYWHYILPRKRTEVSVAMATTLWQTMGAEKESGKKKVLFRIYQSIALDTASLNNLYQIWKKQEPPKGLLLSEEDYTSLALNLTLKEYPDETILMTQFDRITNQDRKERLAFLMPAVSKNKKERDAFFASLKNLSVRKKEAWVATALAYLHHPLRSASSIQYLQPSLEMLEEIQRTNDIFFPGTWLNASLGAYGSKEAADIVRRFLKTHRGYNPQLKMKILQAADPLFRAEKILAM